MAALPYMQLYIADYLADTMHLSTEEHGAYLLLMFNYWQTGKPIPKSRLAKIARLSAERWSVVEPALAEFFEDDGKSWIHLRIERDIEKIGSSSMGQNNLSRSGYRGYLYFIGSDSSELLKIGYSKNPWARVKELRRNQDRSYDVVATIKIVVKPEFSVDEIFSKLVKKGDWFVKNACIEELIKEINAGNITTVVAIHNYVSSYGVVTNVATTSTTNKDKDKDLKPHTQIAGAREIFPPDDFYEPPADPPAGPPAEITPQFSPPVGKFSMFAEWQPEPDFQRRAAIWGRILDGPEPGYTSAELAEFTTYWEAEGKFFHQAQWEQKFSRSVEQSRASRAAAGAKTASKSPPGRNQLTEADWDSTDWADPLRDEGIL